MSGSTTGFHSGGFRTGGGRRSPAVPLDRLVSVSHRLEGIRRSDLAPGDRILVSTRNSIYSLVARADGRFHVSGGWYSRHAGPDGEPPAVAISGCTAGGNAIFTGIVAAPGLFLEFADGTRTTRIRQVRRIPAAARQER
jgi:hypothetical protein